MFKTIITKAIAIAVLGGAAASTHAATLLDREQTRGVFTGGTGTHWFLDDRKWYQFNWGADGTLTVTRIDAKADEEPRSKGTWRIKEVEKKEGMSDADVANGNAALRYVYCHQLDSMWSGHEQCWEAHQVSFDVDAEKKPLPRQEYKFYREAGAETGEYIVTRR